MATETSAFSLCAGQGKANQPMLSIHSVRFGEGLESSHHFVVQLHIEGLLEMFFGLARHFELHVCDLLDKAPHVAVDCVPGNLVLARAFSNSLLGTVMEAADDLHHANRLGKRAEEIVIGETV